MFVSDFVSILSLLYGILAGCSLLNTGQEHSRSNLVFEYVIIPFSERAVRKHKCTSLKSLSFIFSKTDGSPRNWR